MKKYFYNDREITEEEAKRIEAQNSQEEYNPTKNEIFNHLRCSGCTWCGGKGCECYSRTLKECFGGAKNDLIYSHKMKNNVPNGFGIAWRSVWNKTKCAGQSKGCL